MSTLYGVLDGDTLVVSDKEHGLPIVTTDQPAPVDGYTLSSKWNRTNTSIIQVWEFLPIEGSVEDAINRYIIEVLAPQMDDAVAANYVALYPEWDPIEAYEIGTRVRYLGVLYKCIQKHIAQPGWEPNNSPSLWAEILPGQDGSIGEWQQLDSTNPYMKGDVVIYNGHKWESTGDNNVWAPGTTGAPWTDLGEYTA